MIQSRSQKRRAFWRQRLLQNLRNTQRPLHPTTLHNTISKPLVCLQSSMEETESMKCFTSTILIEFSMLYGWPNQPFLCSKIFAKNTHHSGVDEPLRLAKAYRLRRSLLCFYTMSAMGSQIGRLKSTFVFTKSSTPSFYFTNKSLSFQAPLSLSTLESQMTKSTFRTFKTALALWTEHMSMLLSSLEHSHPIEIEKVT